MDAEELFKKNLKKLQEDDVSALNDFEQFHKSEMNIYDKIEFTHEFLDLLSFKLKQSKCPMNKDVLADYILRLFTKTIDKYEYNHKFIASQFKALVTYHKNNKNFDKAVEALELLILHGIIDDDAQRFHIQLDELYRLRKKRWEKHTRAGGGNQG